MLIVVSNRKRNTYRYRRKLCGFGLQYTGNKWSLQTSDDDLIQCVKRYCKRKRLAFESIEDKYVRSTDYRKNFLQQYQRKNGKYFRCAYCGKKLTTQKVTVDHIIPIDKVQHQKRFQRLMKLAGIDNINDIKNLTPACERCNKRKGRKLRGYYIKGLTGRTYKGVMIRRTIKFFVSLILVAAFAFLLMYLYNHGTTALSTN